MGRQVIIREFRELLGDCQGVLLRRSSGHCQDVYQSCQRIFRDLVALAVRALLRELSEDCQEALLRGSPSDCQGIVQRVVRDCQEALLRAWVVRAL